MKGGLDISPWHHRQKPASLSIIGFILFAAICAAAGFGLGKYLVDRDAREAIELFDQLLAENKALNLKMSALRQSQSILENASKIDRVSVQKTQKKLSEMRAVLEEKKELLAFYQRIMAPERSSDALYIQDFRLIPHPEAKGYQFMLTLSQGVGKKRAVKGSFSLSVSGRSNGEDKTLQLKELTTDQKSSVPFSFRYFQTLTRNLTLPDGFAPQRLIVTLKPSGKGAKSVKEGWDWKALVDAE